MAFNGTLAVAGEAFGVVIRTGDNTVLGQIAGLTSSESKRKSPLSMEIERFVYVSPIQSVNFRCGLTITYYQSSNQS